MVIPAVLLQTVVVLAGLAGPDAVRLVDGSQAPLFALEHPGGTAVLPDPEEVAGPWSAEKLRQWVPAVNGGGVWREALWLEREGRVLNLELARAGVALASVRDAGGRHLDELLAATREAQKRRAGLWARVPAQAEQRPMGGVVLALHSRDERYDYGRELDEIRDLGASWVSLVVDAWVPSVDAPAVSRQRRRAPSLRRVEQTVRSARERGLAVLLMPILLIEDPGPDDWRGALRPRDREAWWHSYDAWLADFADLARESGAEALSIGSELSSLERDTDAWRRIAANTRLRYGGLLLYSANWDHFQAVRFWDALDLAGCSAYFALADGPAPSLADLEAGWRRAAREIETLARRSGLPVVLTEVGFPSRVWGAAGPWDYTGPGSVDLGLQERAFQAFRRVVLADARGGPRVRGAFLYEWWGRGGPQDAGYTARGKPAETVWRAILGDLASR